LKLLEEINWRNNIKSFYPMTKVCE
jgi:hypothetical protein